MTPEAKDHAEVEAVPYSADWSVFARRTAAIVLLMACIYCVVITGAVREVLILALILTFLLIYPALLLTRHTKMSYTLAAVLVFLLYLGIIAFAILYLSTPLAEFLGNLAQSVRSLAEQGMSYLQDYTPDKGWIADPRTGDKIVDLDFVLQPLSNWSQGTHLEQLTGIAATAASELGPALGFVGSTMLTGLLANVLAFIFLLEIPSLYRFAVDVIPSNYQREYAILLSRIEHVWGGFLRGSLIAATLTSLITLAQMLIMGIPFAFSIAAVAGITTLIPIVGAFIAMIPIIVVPLTEGSTTLNLDPITLTILVAGIYQGGQLVLWHTAIPKIYGSALALPVSVIIVVLAIGTTVGGILGAFLAIPVTAVLREIVRYVIRKIHGGDPYPGEPPPAFLTEGAFGVRPSSRDVQADAS